MRQARIEVDSQLGLAIYDTKDLEQALVLIAQARFRLQLLERNITQELNREALETTY